ncbi:MAG: DUF4126 domain-containing protein [Methylacidiphilales bacterium]|nr:DUF4126 domain-containing protein [Candidatus Methylacidiphilales bacterium]
MPTVNEPVAAVIVGLLLSLSAGVRITLPLLALNLLALDHLVTLPANLAWLGSEPTLIIVSVACVAETVVHYIPAAGTFLKAAATPLAFVAGTLLMAVPLSGHNPLYQWTLAAFLGGGLSTLTHIGLTGTRAAGEPANVASLGLFGLVWNTGELLVSLILAALGGLCLVAGWAAKGIGLAVLAALILSLLLVAGLRFARAPQTASRV